MHDLTRRNINSQGDEVRIHDDAAIDALPHGRLFREIAQKRARRKGAYGGSFRTIESEIWTVYLEKKAEGKLSDESPGSYVRVAIENYFKDKHRQKCQIPVEKRTTRTQRPHKPIQVQLDTVEDEDGNLMNELENLSEEVNLSNGIRLEDMVEVVPLEDSTYRSRRSERRKREREKVQKNIQERSEGALVHSKRHGRKVFIPRVLGPYEPGEPVFLEPGIGHTGSHYPHHGTQDEPLSTGEPMTKRESQLTQIAKALILEIHALRLTIAKMSEVRR